MPTLLGSIERSVVKDSNQIMTFRIPAFTKRMAKRRARGNGRIKGLDGMDVTEVEVVRPGSAPGQEIYDVTIESVR